MIDFDIVEKIPQKGKPWWYTGVRDENWGGKRKGAHGCMDQSQSNTSKAPDGIWGR